MPDGLKTLAEEQMKNDLAEDALKNTRLVSFLDIVRQGLQELPPAVIDGVLRQGGKLLVTAASKAGKTMFLILLAVVLAAGALWLDSIRCRKSKVLFVNFELTPAEMFQRLNTAYFALRQNAADSNMYIWNLKGQYEDIFPFADNFVPRLISIVKSFGFEVVILDPIYKLLQEDENASKTLSEFCRQTDRIVQETGCSLIYSHHHSKGSQAWKSAMDRGSGSGVIVRDADAVIDLIEIEPKDCGITLEPWQAAFRVEFAALRSFKRRQPLEVIFDYPLFKVTDQLKEASIKYGCSDSRVNGHRGNLKKIEKRDQNIIELRDLVQQTLNSGKTISIQEAADSMRKSVNTIRNYVSADGSGMVVKNNNLYLQDG